jgi:hypothetical protein
MNDSKVTSLELVEYDMNTVATISGTPLLGHTRNKMNFMGDLLLLCSAVIIYGHSQEEVCICSLKIGLRPASHKWLPIATLP